MPIPRAPQCGFVRQTHRARGQHHIVEHGFPWQQVRLLKRNADVPAWPLKLSSADGRVAAGRLNQSCGHFRQR
jgi:hypothetical protein